MYFIGWCVKWGQPGTRRHVYVDNVKFETVDEASLVTTFDFDGFGRLRQVQAPENVRRRYQYSPRDNLTEARTAMAIR